MVRKAAVKEGGHPRSSKIGDHGQFFDVGQLVGGRREVLGKSGGV
jgi:hypothetical protein